MPKILKNDRGYIYSLVDMIDFQENLTEINIQRSIF